MKAEAKIYRPVQENLVLMTYAKSEALKRRDADEGSGHNFRASPCHISHMRAANDLAILNICADAREPTLIALKTRDVNE